MVSIDMETLNAGIKQHCEELIKLFKKIDDEFDRACKAAAATVLILQNSMNTNLGLLAAVEAVRMGALSDMMLKFGMGKIALKEAAKDE